MENWELTSVLWPQLDLVTCLLCKLFFPPWGCFRPQTCSKLYAEWQHVLGGEGNPDVLHVYLCWNWINPQTWDQSSPLMCVFVRSSETWRQDWSSTSRNCWFPPSVWWCWWPTGCVINCETLSLASSSLSITTPTQWLSALARLVSNYPAPPGTLRVLVYREPWELRGGGDQISHFLF